MASEIYRFVQSMLSNEDLTQHLANMEGDHTAKQELGTHIANMSLKDSKMLGQFTTLIRQGLHEARSGPSKKRKRGDPRGRGRKRGRGAAGASESGRSSTEQREDEASINTNDETTGSDFDGASEGEMDDCICLQGQACNVCSDVSSPMSASNNLNGGADPDQSSIPKSAWKKFWQSSVARFELDPAFRKLEEDNSSSARDILRDCQVLPTIDGKSRSEAEVFANLYAYSDQLSKRKGMDHLRWLFAMLMWRELIEILNPERSAQVGPVMKQRLRSYVSEDLLADMRVTREEIDRNIEHWSLTGGRVRAICQALGGSGCLFFLQEQLSVAFLRDQYNKNTQHREAALQHLNSIGLRRRVEQSRLNELGQQILEQWTRGFRKRLQ